MLCTRWDAYNTHIVRSGVPSIAAACSVCVSILHTYQYILALPANFLTYIFDLLTILFVFICIYAYIYSYKHNWAIATGKIIIAFAWITGAASCAIFATISMCASTIDTHKGIFSAKILDTEYRRYHTAATAWCTSSKGNFMAYIKFDTHYPLHTGDSIVFSATAHPTRTPATVHNLYLARKGISAVFYVKQNSIIMHTYAPQGYREQIREYIKKLFYATFTKDAASLYVALYLGNKEYIHPHVQNAFKDAGVLHVLAASGLHVGIIVFCIMAIGKLLSAPKKILLLLAALCVCIYLLISDQPVSLMRASLMCVAGALCIAFNAQKHSINILCVTACIILCLYPYELFSAGFQLSFLATAGILLVYTSYHNGLKHCGTLAAPLAITFAAQLFTMPVSIYHFQELSAISFIANLVIIPLVSVYMIAGILTPVMSYVGAGNVFCYCINWLYGCIALCIKFFASLHGTVYITSLVPLVLYTIILVLPLLYKRAANTIICASLLATILYTNQPQAHSIISGKTDSSWYAAKIVNGNAYCILALHNYSDYTQLVKRLKEHAITKLNVLLPDASFKNCNFAIMLGKQFCLNTIYVSDYTPLAISRLTYMAYIDHIPMYFIQNNPNLLQQPEWQTLWDMYNSTKHAPVK